MSPSTPPSAPASKPRSPRPKSPSPPNALTSAGGGSGGLSARTMDTRSGRRARRAVRRANDSITILSMLSAVVMSAVNVTSAPPHAFSCSFCQIVGRGLGQQQTGEHDAMRAPAELLVQRARPGRRCVARDEVLVGLLADVLHRLELDVVDHRVPASFSPPRRSPRSRGGLFETVGELPHQRVGEGIAIDLRGRGAAEMRGAQAPATPRSQQAARPSWAPRPTSAALRLRSPLHESIPRPPSHAPTSCAGVLTRSGAGVSARTARTGDPSSTRKRCPERGSASGSAWMRASGGATSLPRVCIALRGCASRAAACRVGRECAATGAAPPSAAPRIRTRSRRVRPRGAAPRLACWSPLVCRLGRQRSPSPWRRWLRVRELVRRPARGSAFAPAPRRPVAVRRNAPPAITIRPHSRRGRRTPRAVDRIARHTSSMTVAAARIRAAARVDPQERSATAPGRQSLALRARRRWRHVRRQALA